MFPLYVADLLEATSERIRTRQWVQGSSAVEDDKICLAVGLSECAAEMAADESFSQEYSYLDAGHKALAAHQGWTVKRNKSFAEQTIEWNDRRGRTEDEVHDLLLHTAKEIRNEHQDV